MVNHPIEPPEYSLRERLLWERIAGIFNSHFTGNVIIFRYGDAFYDIACFDRCFNYHRDTGHCRCIVRPQFAELPNFIRINDIYHLPFRDGEFQTVLCSHTIEHVDDPESFYKELARVGKKVTLVIPPLWDISAVWNVFEHKWIFLTLKKEHNSIPRYIRLPLSPYIQKRRGQKRRPEGDYSFLVWIINSRNNGFFSKPAICMRRRGSHSPETVKMVQEAALEKGKGWSRSLYCRGH